MTRVADHRHQRSANRLPSQIRLRFDSRVLSEQGADAEVLAATAQSSARSFSPRSRQNCPNCAASARFPPDRRKLLWLGNFGSIRDLSLISPVTGNRPSSRTRLTRSSRKSSVVRGALRSFWLKTCLFQRIAPSGPELPMPVRLLDAAISEEALNAERNTSICGGRSTDLRQNVFLRHHDPGSLSQQTHPSFWGEKSSL